MKKEINNQFQIVYKQTVACFVAMHYNVAAAAKIFIYLFVFLT